MITVYARSAESPFPAGPELGIVRTAACVADESETLYIKRTEQIANSVQKTIVLIAANCIQSSRVCKKENGKIYSREYEKTHPDRKKVVK